MVTALPAGFVRRVMTGTPRSMFKGQAIGQAAEDLRYLLARGYPKASSITLVGNRYNLDADRRHLLRRAVCSPGAAAMRRDKLVSVSDLRSRRLAVDGFNVLITLESALTGRPLVRADDGVVRDIAGLSSGYRPDGAENGATNRALGLVFDLLAEADLETCYVGFQAAMSHSGALAALCTRELSARGVPGWCETLRSVESQLPSKGEIVATSNSVLMDRAHRVFDLAGSLVIERLDLAVRGL